MRETLGKSALRVQAAFAEYGLDLLVVELPDSTRTAHDTANAIRWTDCQIILN